MRQVVFVAPRLEDGLHDVDSYGVRSWGFARGLNGNNLQQHVVDPVSDHKCGGWRLVERVRWLQHIKHEDWLIPAVGTMDMFMASCARSADDRGKLANKRNVLLLLSEGGKYVHGKPYTVWRLKKLTVAEAEKRLRAMSAAARSGTDPFACPRTDGTTAASPSAAVLQPAAHTAAPPLPTWVSWWVGEWVGG